MRDEIETECCNQNSILSVSDLLTKFHHRIDRHRSCSPFGANTGAKGGLHIQGELYLMICWLNPHPRGGRFMCQSMLQG